MTILLECGPVIANRFASRLIALGVKSMPMDIALEDVGVKITLKSNVDTIDFDGILEVFKEMEQEGATLTQEKLGG